MQPSSADLLYWLATTHLQGVGPVTLLKALNAMGEIKNVFKAATSDLRNIGFAQNQIDAIKKLEWQIVERELMWCQKNKCELIAFSDARYPKLLKEIANPPMLLFVQGEVALLNSHQLAMVGSRNPSITGRELANRFASQLTQSGLTITSGLALGIDTASHQGALQGQGKTIAVLGTGLNHIYPSSNKKLADEIKERGALITEFSPETPPKANHFPLRNRLISGLSLGVLVVEAAIRSGSLITARHAVEQGRDVFAFPGSVHNSLAKGCHHLIKQGAKLVESIKDILEELGQFTAVVMESIVANKVTLDNQKRRLIEQIGYEITSFDAIILRSGLTANEVSSMLLSLELEGYITVVQGGYIRNM